MKDIKEMNRYAELRKRHQKEFRAIPIEFAFANKQFDKMMDVFCAGLKRLKTRL